MEKFFVKDFEDLIPEKNTSPYKRVLVIGDIHGNFTRLMSLWKKIHVTDNDFVFFLGDYLDRGEEVGETVRWVLQKSEEKNIVFLRGNHEQMFINVTAKDDSAKEWLRIWFCNGGQQTLAQLKKFCATEPDIDKKFLRLAKKMATSCSIKIGGKSYFLCHAGVDPNYSLDEQIDDDLLGIREEFFDHYEGDAVIICGHSPVQYFFENADGKPFRIPNRNILMTDTGSYYPDGAISCVNILTGEFWQSDDNEKQEGIMFVCAGNTCRSPMAEYVMKYLIEKAGVSEKFFVDSAGCFTGGGDLISTESAVELRKNNIPFSNHISKPFTQEEYKKFKYIIAMDEYILNEAKEMSGGDPENKICLLKDFDGKEIIVEDPFGTDKHPKAYSEISLGCAALMKELLP